MKPQEQIEFWVNRTREVIRLQNKSLATERDYCQWLRRYFAFTTKLAKGFTPEQKAEKFLTWLAVDQDVSGTTQNAAFFAIVFFYKNVVQKPLGNLDCIRAQRRECVRTAPPMDDTLRLLAALPDVSGYPTNLQGRILYSRGLRVCEPLNLRLKDVRFGDRKLILIAAKGNKDRVVRLDEWMIEPLQRQMVAALLVWESDCRNGIPLEIPNQLAKKYPETRFSKHWAWLFPAQQTCRHPRTGEIVRYRQHECYLQRAFKIARQRTGVMATPHNMRHAHATHLLESGAASVSALQKEMGHVDPRTTMGYCHGEALSVPDPQAIAVRRQALMGGAVMVPSLTTGRVNLLT